MASDAAPNQLAPIEALGDAILRDWSAVDFVAEALPAVAARALSAATLSTALSFQDVARWCVSTAGLPPQPGLDHFFGQPSTTLFHHERFYIDALLWLDSTAGIHEHSFAGAFTVLHGSSLHTVYSFESEREFGPSLRAGKLELQRSETLTPGMVREIPPGSQFIHALFHLDQPSVSIVVRTPGQPRHQPQMSYLRCGLCFDPESESPDLKRRLQWGESLLRLGEAELVAAAIEAADEHTTVRLLMHLVEAAEDDTVVSRALAVASKLHPGLAQSLEATVMEVRRQNNLIRRRTIATDSEHRFFFAVLLNLPTRAEILSAVEQRHPGLDPIAKIMEWVGQLAATSPADTKNFGVNLLGVPMSAGTLAVFEGLLRGRPENEILAEAGDPKRAVKDLMFLPRSLLFSGLFEVNVER